MEQLLEWYEKEREWMTRMQQQMQKTASLQIEEANQLQQEHAQRAAKLGNKVAALLKENAIAQSKLAKEKKSKAACRLLLDEQDRSRGRPTRTCAQPQVETEETITRITVSIQSLIFVRSRDKMQ